MYFYDNKPAKTKFNGITYGMDIINAGNSRISDNLFYNSGMYYAFIYTLV